MTDSSTRKVKTSINIQEDLWKKFHIKVIQDYGGRKMSDVLEELIKAFVNSSKRGGEER